jgi:hypothetical protein
MLESPLKIQIESSSSPEYVESISPQNETWQPDFRLQT